MARKDTNVDLVKRGTTKRIAALRHRDFLHSFLGKNCSFVAIHGLLAGVSYQVYDITGNILNLAWLGPAIFASAINFALLTGYAADRFDRRLILTICSYLILSAAVLFAIMPLYGPSQIWSVFLTLVILGGGRVFFNRQRIVSFRNSFHSWNYPMQLDGIQPLIKTVR